MAQPKSTPSQQKALVFHSVTEPLQVKTVPVPQPSSGSAIIRVITTGILSYTREVYNGTRNYLYPTPFTPGSASVGQIVAVGSDVTTLVSGDLVMTHPFLRGRDNPDALCLQGLHQGGTEHSRRLVDEEFRNGTYTQYAKVPLENCTKIPDDSRNPNDYLNLNRMLVPFGGLTGDGGLDLKPGESVVVAPATGQFGGSAVEVALAMGAKVIALGRNAEALKSLANGLSAYGSRLRTVQMTGNEAADAKAVGPVDCYFDISPPMAAKSTHIKSCFSALKPRGRVCLMGGIHEDVPIPHGKILRESIQIFGKWMYEWNAPRRLVQMVEAGILDISRYTSKSFSLDEWNEAFEHAANNMRWGQLTVFAPGSSPGTESQR